MALKGSFSKLVSGNFGLICEWNGVQSQSGNYTKITLDVYLQYYHIDVGSRNDGTVSINGESATFSTTAIYSYTDTWKKKLLTSYTIKVPHNSDGKKTGVKLSASWRCDGTYSNVKIEKITASASIDLDPITVYKLSVSADTGSKISVSRTSSGFGNTGRLSSGAIIYKNDKLKITFTPEDNYKILTHTVNGSTFTSGATHTVSGDVSVKSTAQILASDVGATDANIGSKSTITVTKYSTSYYHSLKYAFGKLSGYINSDGSLSASEKKYKNTSISFSIPESFYAQIPNAKYGECTITCTTYGSASSTTVLGEPTQCKMTLTASEALCKPKVSGSVEDTNEITKKLTGDSKTLVKYKSNAKCTIGVTLNNSSIYKKYINNVQPTNDIRTINGVTDTSFVFSATDSRRYSNSTTVRPKIIDYIPLTLVPKIVRQEPTNGKVLLSVSGNYFNGNFGAYNNSLSIQYCYKESTQAAYSAWKSVSGVTIGTKSYNLSNIVLDGDFDYQKSYIFKVKASDGANNITLSTVEKPVNVSKGIPVYDWGESDFKFNVPVKIKLPQSSGDAWYNPDEQTGGGLDMYNSDIVRLNGLWFADKTELDNNEGLNFYRDGSNWDMLKAYDGNLYFIPNYPENKKAYLLTLPYTAGDSISINTGVCFGGYITSSSKLVTVTIPLDKPIANVSGVNVSGQIFFRGISGYVYPATANRTYTDKYVMDLDNVHGFTKSVEIRNNMVYLALTFTDKVLTSSSTAYTSNTPITASRYYNSSTGGYLRITFT